MYKVPQQDLSKSSFILQTFQPRSICEDVGCSSSIDDSMKEPLVESHESNRFNSPHRVQSDDINNSDSRLRKDTNAPSGSTAVQSNSIPVAQRATLATGISLMEIHGIWYWMTMMVPFVNIANCYHSSTTSRSVLNAAELVFTQILRLLREFNNQITRLGQEQIVRDVFATAMDIMLIIYAIGFLILSLYQASIIG